MKILFITLCICLSVGCGPKPTSTDTTLKKQKVNSVTYDANGTSITCHSTPEQKVYLEVGEYWTTITFKFKKISNYRQIKTEDLLSFDTSDLMW